MVKKDVLAKTLAICGTLLMWFPILATLIFSVFFFSRSGMLRIDYLTPAEFFPAALIGGALLVWAAIRTHSRLKLVCWGIGIVVVSLLGALGLAQLSGLDSAETEPTGVWFGIVLALLAVYMLALIFSGVVGGLLIRDLFAPKPIASPAG